MKFENFNFYIIFVGIGLFLLYATGVLALFAGGVFVFKMIMGL